MPATDSSSFDDFYDRAPCGFHSLDRHGIFVSINDTELAWLEYEREEVIGRLSFADLLAPESRQLFADSFPRFMACGWAKDLEFELVAKSGRRLTALLSATAIYDRDRRYVASRSIVIDITARKQAERERDRFFDLSLDMLCISSADGCFTRLNPAFTATLGWSIDQMLARPYLDFVHPDDVDATIREVERQTSAGETTLRFENRYRHKDGSWRRLSWASVPQPGGLMYASARDVTELRRAEDALRRSEENLAVTLDSIGDGVLATDTQGRITRMNPVAERLCGWTEAEALGRPIGDVFRIVSEETGEPAVVPVDGVLATGAIHGLANHTALVARDGRETAIADSAAPIRGLDGEITGVVLVFRDVSGERAAAGQADALMKDLNDIRAALDEHAIVTLTDPQGRMTAANDRFCDAFGFTREELIGSNHRIVNSGHHATPFFRDLWETITRGEVWKGEIRNRTKSGTLGWFDTTIVPFLKSDGTPCQFVSIQTDITERKQAEDDIRALVEARTAELHREKLFSDAVIESVSGLFYVLDQQGRFVRWNQALQDLLGTSADGMMRAHALSFVHEDDQALCAARIAEAFVAGQAEAELRIRGRDGLRHAILTARRMTLDGVTYLAGAGMDITEVKESQIVRDEALMTLDATVDAVFIFDPDTLRFTYVNQGAIRQLGYSRSRLLELTPLDLRPGLDEAHFRAMLEPIESGRTPSQQLTTRYRHRDGHELPVEINLQCIRPRHGGKRRFVAVVRDVTERQRAQDAILALNADLERRISERTGQLETARQAADAASRAKSAFLANMSHEIRTPLNAIAGMVELLERVTDRTERARMLRVTRESAKALAGIIDDVLDFSKIEAGLFDVNLEPMSLRDVIRSAIDVFASSASAKNLSLRHSLDPRLPEAVLCDALRLKQILFNLLGNAIKFTSAGGIDVGSTLLERHPTTAVIRITTSDTGIGIDAEAQARIFQPFVQGEANTTRRFGGTGLGLAISQRLAGLLGGHLTVESTPGQGTTVTLTMTVTLADPADLPAAADRDGDALTSLLPVPATPGRLLIVDDSPINREVLHRQLAALGYDADEAVDGLDALELWRAGDYVMVIADCHMPSMDGYQLARAIRRIEAAEPGRRRTPIVGYTANAGKDARDLCTQAGMDDALIKPVPLHTLGMKIGAWLPGHSPADAESTPRAAAPAAAAGPVAWPELLEITGGDEHFGREMLQAFVAQKTADTNRLSQMLGDGDLGDIAALAHRLKGAARTVAARPLAAVLEAIESAARNGRRNEAVESARSLADEVSRLAAAVSADEDVRHV